MSNTSTNVEIKKDDDDIPEEELEEGLDEKSQARTGFIKHLSNNYEQMKLLK